MLSCCFTVHTNVPQNTPICPLFLVLVDFLPLDGQLIVQAQNNRSERKFWLFSPQKAFFEAGKPSQVTLTLTLTLTLTYAHEGKCPIDWTGGLPDEGLMLVDGELMIMLTVVWQVTDEN